MVLNMKVTNVISLFKPSANWISPNNRGLRAILYGQQTDGYVQAGLIHVVTAIRFRTELKKYLNNGMSTFWSGWDEWATSSAVADMCRINDSIPRNFKDAFLELQSFPRFADLPQIRMLSGIADKIREFYDRFLVNPQAKVKSKTYFGFQKFKGLLGFDKIHSPEIDSAFCKKLFPDIELPQNPSTEKIKTTLINRLISSNYSAKEIEDILAGKAPKFYRFVSETELRALRNGYNVHSSVPYRTSLPRTALTTNPCDNSNRYRITFQTHSKWNPFAKGVDSDVLPRDMASREYSLRRPYSQEDILCVERVLNGK